MAAKSSSSTTSRAFALIEHVAASTDPLALPDIVEATGFPKSTVHRLLQLLEAEGLLAREPDGKHYAAGPRLGALALAALKNSSVRAERRAILQALVDEVGETCNFTMLDGDEIVYLDRIEAHWPMRLMLAPGSHVPLHCTASGKLFLAMMPLARCRRLLAAAPLKRMTRNTIIDRSRLLIELERIRGEKIGTDDEEFVTGLTAVAVPVQDARGRMLATVAVHAASPRMSMAVARSHVPALRRAAAKLAVTLSG
jgi:IclR family transcriptional regulator, acetate operon repressor